MGERGLESLEAWQKARALAVTICRDVVPLLPPEERWCLATQLRRSAQSIPANIAEGFGRYYYQEGIRFCYIARGSLEETWSHICLANDLGYLTGPRSAETADGIRTVRRLLNGYIAFLKRSRRGADEPGAQHMLREEAVSHLADFRGHESGDDEPCPNDPPRVP